MARVPLPIAVPTAVPPEAVPVRLDSGFYDEERQETDVFRWMGREGVLSFARSDEKRFLELWVFSPFGDLSQRLELQAGAVRETLALAHGWFPVALELPAGAAEVRLTASRLLPSALHPADPRELSLRVRRPALHRDPRHHAALGRQLANAVHNQREMLEGRSWLESTPVSLGIDLHGACNVKPPCVYCEWDLAKQQEGDAVSTPFTLETLAEYGPLYTGAAQLVNCSIGEPFMMPQINALLDAIGADGKALEMSTNGQILTDRNAQKLLGRQVHLYVSLDAATPTTYARLRNDTLERILANLRRLLAARQGFAGLPRVFLVFMPMRANLHELEAFVELCAELGVDKLVLRPLNATPGNDLDWERSGYRFRYSEELLPFEQLLEVSARAAELCRRHGVELLDQLAFGELPQKRPAAATTTRAAAAVAVAPAEPAVESAAASPPAAQQPAAATVPPESLPAAPADLGFGRWPICVEPWRNFYVLRRGLRPCCYGGESIGVMSAHRDAWNGPLVRSLRRELARGRLHDYCLRSPACPITRRVEHSGRLDLRQRALLLAWRSWQALNSATRGWPRRVWQPLRDAVRGSRAHR